MSTRVLSFALLFLISLGITLGCSKKSAPASMSGKVTYKGEPVTGGNIVFHTSTGPYPTGLTVEGTYSVSDLPEGECTVTVTTESLNPAHKQPSYDQKTASKGAIGAKYKGAPAEKGKGKFEKSPAPESASQNENGHYKKIPAKYADKDKSTLKVTLKPGSQEQNFELTD